MACPTLSCHVCMMVGSATTATQFITPSGFSLVVPDLCLSLVDSDSSKKANNTSPRDCARTNALCWRRRTRQASWRRPVRLPLLHNLVDVSAKLAGAPPSLGGKLARETDCPLLWALPDDLQPTVGDLQSAPLRTMARKIGNQ